MNIFVTNLHYKVQSEELRQLFEEYGKVDSAKVIMDHETGRSKGYGFVEMPDDTNAQQAIDELDGAEIMEKTIIVKKAKPREQRPARSGNSGGGYNRSNGFDGNRRRENFNNR